MSKVTKIINNIKSDLDSISGLDGIVADFLAVKEVEIHAMVEYVKEKHPSANIFDYFGKDEIEE